jgi:hypothetical protein
MSEAGGETIAHPADRHESIRTLPRAGRNDEAIVRLCAIHITRPSDLVARELLFDAYFQKRDWSVAFTLADDLARQQPGVARLEKAVIGFLTRKPNWCNNGSIVASRSTSFATMSCTTN